MPFSVEGREIVVSWPVSFRFEAIGPGGRLAWQIFAVYVLVFVLAWTVKNLATFISNYYTRWVGAKVVSDLRDQGVRQAREPVAAVLRQDRHRAI